MRLRILIAAFLGCFSLLVAGQAGAQISLLGLKNSLVQFALDQISVPGELEITAEGVEEPEDGATRIVGLTLADGEGVWMRIGALSLRWNPARILRGQLDIESIVASDVEVLRRPNAAPTVREDAAIAETDDDPFDWPRSPINVRIGEMRLDRVRVAEGVIAGQSLAFDATGSLRDEGAEQSVRLSLTRTDEIAGRILLDYLRTFDTDTLRLTLEADEAPGGLVAELAGFPDDSASRVRVDADGPLTDWRMSVSASADQVFDLDGQAVVEATGRLLVDAGFTLVPGPAIGPTAEAVLGERAELAFRIAEDEGGIVRVEQGRLSSPHLRLTASGTYAKPTGAVDLAVDLDAGPGLAVLAEGVAFQGFGFEGQVQGVVPEDVTAEGQLSLQGLRTEPADVGTARLATTVTVAGERIGFDVDGQVTGLRIDRLTPDLLGETGLRAAGAFDQGVLTLDGLVLDSPLLTLEAEGRADTAASTAALDYSLGAPALGPVASAYDVAASGGMQVEGRVEGPFEAIRVEGFARLSDLVFEGEGYGDVTLDHAVTIGDPIAGRVGVTATGSPFGPAEVETEFTLRDETLALSSMTASALGVTAEGAASVALETTLVEGAVDIRAPDLGALAPVTERFAGERLAGAATGRVTMTPQAGRQDIGLDLTVTGFSGFEAEVARLGVTGQVRDALGTPSAEATLTVSEARHPQASLGSGEITADLADLTGAPSGTVEFDLQGLAPAGAAEIRRLTGTADLADLASDPSGTLDFRAEGIDAAGAASVAGLTGRAEFAGVATTPSATLRAEASRIEAVGIAVPSATLDANLGADGRLQARLGAPTISGEGVSVDGTEVTASVVDALGARPVLDIALRATRAEASPLTLTAPRITARGPLSALEIAADATGEADAGPGEPVPVTLAVRARANAAGPEVTATVSQFRLGLGEAEVALRAPLAIRSSGGTTRLADLDLALPGGSLTGSVARFPSGLGGDLVLAMTDFAAFSAALDPLGVAVPLSSGEIEARASFDTRPGPARAEVTVTGRELRFADVIADIGALGLDASLDWDGRRAEAEATLSGPFGEPLRLTAAAPLRPTAEIVPAIPRGGEIEGEVAWQGELGDLWALVPLTDHILRGQLDLDLTLGGRLEEPQIGGSVSLTEGQYQNLETGTILTHLTLSSTLDGEGGIILDLDARDGASGTVEARIEIDPETLDATLTAREAVLVRRDDVRAQMSADITARGPLTAFAVEGRVLVDRAEVRLVNTTPPDVATLGDVRFKGEPAPEPEEPAGGSITLDIEVEAPRNVFVRGRGLDSEWRIDLDVDGTAASPRVVGVIERIRGRLDLLGRDFELETGEVRFTGGGEIDPTLDISMAHTRDGFTGRIQVRGTASDPEIGFASDPQVPEEEVLPRTLFNRSRQSLSPTEAIQLANAIATLLDGSGGFVDDLRGAAGIDVLRIDEDGDGVSVTVGKNVADGVFVGVSQPVGGGSAEVQVEVEVYESVTVDAEIGQEEGSSIGLNWRKDF